MSSSSASERLTLQGSFNYFVFTLPMIAQSIESLVPQSRESGEPREADEELMFNRSLILGLFAEDEVGALGL